MISSPSLTDNSDPSYFLTHPGSFKIHVWILHYEDLTFLKKSFFALATMLLPPNGTVLYLSESRELRDLSQGDGNWFNSKLSWDMI